MRRFNIGLIGCGDIATTWHVPTLLASKRVHVSGICDIDAAKMNKLQERCHFETATEDYRELLNRPEIDAVVVTTMPWVTPKITVEALERGKHVLCEKPMAVTTADARAVAEAEKRTGYKVMVGFTYRHDPMLHRLRAWIKEGILGSPLLYRVSVFDEVWNPSGAPEHYKRIDETMRHGCPSVHDGAHNADFLNLLTDASPVAEVRSFGFKSRPEFASSNYDISIIDFADGSRARMEIAWFYPVFPKGGLEVLGPNGLAEFDCYTRRLKLTAREKTADVTGEGNWWEECFRLQLDHFLDALEAGRTPVPGVAEGLYSLQLTKRIEASMNMRDCEGREQDE